MKSTDIIAQSGKKGKHLPYHLCGSVYEAEGRCEHLLYVDQDGMMYGRRALQKYYVYCTAEGRCRSMGCAASWTGNSPKWCPRRKAGEV